MAINVGLLGISRRINVFRAFHRRTYSSNNGKKGLVLGVYTSDGSRDVHLTPASESFNDKTKGKLLEYINLIKTGLTLGKGHLFHSPAEEFPIVAIVGLGKKGTGYNEKEEIYEERENARIAASVGSRLLQDIGVTKVFLEGLGHQESAAEGATLGTWYNEAFKNKAKQKVVPEIELYGTTKEHGWKAGLIKAEAQNLARKLMDFPANHKTPTVFGQIVSEALNLPGVEMFVRNKNWIEDQKMTSFLSVARGSSEPPVFLEINYKQGSKQQKPIAFVGKGIIFDSGGISLKSALHMDAMRGDCGGASCVVGAIYAAARLKLPINIVGLIPLTDNMPDGAAVKPGDVVYAKNGKSITVIDTDFEGRLILCDALCYAQEFEPRITINLATLTMEIIYALGNSASGAYSNSTSLFEEMRHAGALSGDRVWKMPLWNYYSQQVKDSQYSDLINLTGPGTGTPGGSCTAAAFLQEFVPKGEWMHLDIASVMGPADPLPYISKGMTGRPTRTLVEFLIKQSKK